ncbi:hypothetical protein EJ110_NYTH15522 [Nymphaea thermarum]|nr:hypothetical protein EJ110_NYTH15522 [Nymphaea thermarum]
MAEEMTSKTDVTFDTGSNTKSENLPVQVISWSAALEIGITSRGRLPYITGEKPVPSKTDPGWATWALEDSQVKVWTVLARMYGRKKRVLCTYQIKRNIYSLKQGDLSVASFYAALKTKWEELDYHVNDDWNCGSDHEMYWQKEWMDRTFIFLGGLRDEFESIRSQILNCDETPGIEEVYARVESEEQRCQVMHIDSSHGSSPSAFVSRAPGTGSVLSGGAVIRLTRGRPSSGRRGPPVPDTSSPSVEKPRLSSDQLKELQAYISRLSTTKEEASTSKGAQLAQALVATSDQGASTPYPSGTGMTESNFVQFSTLTGLTAAEPPSLKLQLPMKLVD